MYDPNTFTPAAMVGAFGFALFAESRLSACLLGYAGYLTGVSFNYGYWLYQGLKVPDAYSTLFESAAAGLLVGPAAGLIIYWGKRRRSRAS